MSSQQQQQANVYTHEDYYSPTAAKSARWVDEDLFEAHWAGR